MGCGLGYRTRYIQNAAAQASSGTLDLSALAALPDDALFSRLLELDGVGKGSKLRLPLWLWPYRDGSH